MKKTDNKRESEHTSMITWLKQVLNQIDLQCFLWQDDLLKTYEFDIKLPPECRF